jgi:HD superfamily phosphohydrolase
LDALTSGEAKASHSWIEEMIASPIGADVLDYIDRDALFCGLDHRVDSAIYRRYAIDKTVPAHSERHLVAKLYGRHGFRIDADYALLSLLRERFALFLKVYTHPAKVAAGAMLGKAVLESALDEPRIETMGDDELLLWLRDSKQPVSAKLGAALLTRNLYKPVFRARALQHDETSEDQYRARQRSLAQLGLFRPETRAEFEREFAEALAINPEDIIVYATENAPGAQKVEQHVETAKGRMRYRDEVHRPYQAIFRDHLSLWAAYVFVNPMLSPDKKMAVAEKAEAKLRLKNEIEADRRQLVLEF